MIATLKPPKNKHELAKAILSLKNPKIDVIGNTVRQRQATGY